MANARACELYLIHYVPNVLTGTRVIIGIMLVEIGAQPECFADVRFLKSWSQVKGMHPAADLEVLQALEQEFRRLLTAKELRIFNYRGPQLPREWLVKTALDSFSNAIQVSDGIPVMLQEPQSQIDEFARMYLQPPTSEGQRAWDLRTRRGIKREMEDQLRQANLLNFMRHDVAVSQYIGAGSKLKIDFSYKPNGVVHLLHAQHLIDAEPAVAQIIQVYPPLREGIEREEHAMSTLTIVTEDLTALQKEEVAYSLGLLKELEGEGLEVVPVSNFNRVVEVARREMRV